MLTIIIFLFYLYLTFLKCKQKNKNYQTGTFEIRDNILSISYGKEGREFKTEDVNALYIGKHSIFLLINNTNLFYYFSLLDKTNIIDILKSNNVIFDMRRLH